MYINSGRLGTEATNSESLPLDGGQKDYSEAAKLEKQLYISPLDEGTVIDHLHTKNNAFEIMSILGLNEYIKSGARVLMATNVPSASMGQKHIIKIEARPTMNFCLLGLLGVERPVTVSFIEDYQVVYKEELTPPKYFEGVVRCANNSCISNFDLNTDGTINYDATPEPVTSRFEATKIDNNSTYRCCWCGTYQEGNILERIRPEITSDMPPWVQSPMISPYAIRSCFNHLNQLYGFMKGEFLFCPIDLGGQQAAFWRKHQKGNVYLTPTDNLPTDIKEWVDDL